MSKLVFVGQAPSRVGDGRAFSGPSGRRLAALMNLRDYEHLAMQCTLTNIFSIPAERKPLPARRSTKRNAPGDQFDEKTARANGKLMVKHWAEDVDDKMFVVACGLQVYKALTGKKGEFYHGVEVSPGVEIWCFPHPSGASQYWNHRANVLRAANFLRRLQKRAGIVMAR